MATVHISESRRVVRNSRGDGEGLFDVHDADQVVQVAVTADREAAVAGIGGDAQQLVDGVPGPERRDPYHAGVIRSFGREFAETQERSTRIAVSGSSDPRRAEVRTERGELLRRSVPTRVPRRVRCPRGAPSSSPHR